MICKKEVKNKYKKSVKRENNEGISDQQIILYSIYSRYIIQYIQLYEVHGELTVVTKSTSSRSHSTRSSTMPQACCSLDCLVHLCTGYLLVKHNFRLPLATLLTGYLHLTTASSIILIFMRFVITNLTTCNKYKSKHLN